MKLSVVLALFLFAPVLSSADVVTIPANGWAKLTDVPALIRPKKTIRFAFSIGAPTGQCYKIAIASINATTGIAYPNTSEIWGCSTTTKSVKVCVNKISDAPAQECDI